MADKPRVPRKPEAEGLRKDSLKAQVEPAASGQDHLVQQRFVELEEQLAKARQDLDKRIKISRSLARNCTRAEQELRRQEEGFALIRQYGTDLIFRVDRDGKIQDLSDACQALLGMDPATLVGRFFQDFVARAHQELLRRYFIQVLDHKDFESAADGLVVSFQHPQRGPLRLEIFGRAVPHPQTQALEILGLARSAAPPPKPSPEDALEDLAASLAHELNQPLTALAIAARACAQLALDNDMDRAELAGAIEQLAVQAERAGELVRRMRQLAARDAGRRSTVTVPELVQKALHMLQADLEKDQVRVQLHLPEELPTLWVDRIQIEQVLINLIRNAVEAMQETPAKQRALTITATPAETEVVLAIADSGRGLSPDIAGRLFQPYQTTKVHGMGLGLAVSRAILHVHGGRIWVEPLDISETSASLSAGPGRSPGAVFCFTLPFASMENATTAS